MIKVYQHDLTIRKTNLGLLNKYILICSSMKIFNFFNKVNRIIFHLELPMSVYDKKLRIGHPFNIFINKKAKIGYNITIYHNVTIGSKQWGKRKGTPVLGDNVIIYPNSIVIGDISVGKNSIIGAGSVVVDNVDDNSIVAGNPAIQIGKIIEMDE